MADSIYTRMLARAIEIEGSAQSIAQLLRVPEATLLRWRNGRAFMPLQAFYRLLSYIADAERRDVNSVSYAERQPVGEVPERLLFPVAKRFAHCAHCDGIEFRRATPDAPLQLTSTLSCCACGKPVVHRSLLEQVAQDVIANKRADPRTRAPRRGALPQDLQH